MRAIQLFRNSCLLFIKTGAGALKREAGTGPGLPWLRMGCWRLTALYIHLLHARLCSPTNFKGGPILCKSHSWALRDTEWDKAIWNLPSGKGESQAYKVRNQCPERSIGEERLSLYPPRFISWVYEINSKWTTGKLTGEKIYKYIIFLCYMDGAW